MQAWNTHIAEHKYSNTKYTVGSAVSLPPVPGKVIL